MSLKHRLLGFFNRTLPASANLALKQWYYHHLIDRVPESSEPDLAIIKALLHPGDFTVSIGANIGVYAKFLSRYVGPQGRVFSFEPIPPTYRFLRSNLEHLAVQNVSAFNLAVSDEAGVMRMDVPTYPDGSENFYEAHLVEGAAPSAPGHRRYEVEVVRLDDFLAAQPEAAGRRVALLKCDAEGHEYYCFRGAEGTLRKDRPVVFVEISEPTGDLANNRTLNWLKGLGYEIYFNQEGRLVRAQREHCSVNYFGLLPDHPKI